MENPIDEKSWLRAQSIANFGVMKMNTVEELENEYKIKHLLKQHKEAQDSENLLTKQLIDLYEDRKAYIEAMDKIAELAGNAQPEYQGFWINIMGILQKESSNFKLANKKSAKK